MFARSQSEHIAQNTTTKITTVNFIYTLMHNYPKHTTSEYNHKKQKDRVKIYNIQECRVTELALYTGIYVNSFYIVNTNITSQAQQTCSIGPKNRYNPKLLTILQQRHYFCL